MEQRTESRVDALEQSHDRQGHEPARPVPDPLLFRRLPGSRQRRLRGADDERGPRASASAFGFGAGIFFLAYFLFEVPSNLFLERFGARKWIARIMFTWGLISGAMAFVGGRTSASTSCGSLLGVAEAGFFPGIIFYLTLWFPAVYRARIIGYFMAAIPLSTVFGAPVSGLLLGLHGVMGLKGWQWLFLIEAAPALILSVRRVLLPDRSPGGRRLAGAGRARVAGARGSIRNSGNASGASLQRVAGAAEPEGPGAQPRLLRRGRDQLRPELLPAADRQGLRRVERPGRPRIGAAVHRSASVSIVLWGHRSDRKRERRFHLAFPLAVAAAGIALSTVFDESGAEDARPLDCRLRHLRQPAGVLDAADRVPVRRRRGRRHRADQLHRQPGRVRRPLRDGRIKDWTGSYTGGLLALSAVGLMAMALVLVLGHDSSLEHAPGAPAPDKRAGFSTD